MVKKRFLKKHVIGLILVNSLLLTACSAATNTQHNMESASGQEETATESFSEITEDTETTAKSEIEETEETSLTESIDEAGTTSLKIYAFADGVLGVQTGWFADVLQEQLNAEIEILWPEEMGEADIIIWPAANDEFYEWAESGKLLEWREDFLNEYGQTIRANLWEYLEYESELTEGILYGFTGNAGNVSDGEYHAEGNRIFTISAGSEHSEEAMRFLDWLASAEGTLTSWYGPKGLCWDIDEDGYYYLTELGKDCWNDPATWMPDGTKFYEGNIMFSNKIWSSKAKIYDSVYGEPYDCDYWYRNDDKDITSLKICAFRSDYYGKQMGWFADVLREQVNVRIELLRCGDDANLKEADIIIWPIANEEFYKWVNEGRLLEWEEEFLNEYGQTIRAELSEYLKYEAELTDGVLYGLSGDAGYFSTKEYHPEAHSIFTINSASEHPEAALQFLDWLASSEGTLTYWYGPKGLCWDVDEDGYYYLTELGRECQHDELTQMPDGLEFDSGYSLFSELVWHLQAEIYDSVHGERYDWESWQRMSEE